MAHQANPEENFNDKFQWNKSKVKTFTKTAGIVGDDRVQKEGDGNWDQWGSRG